MHLLEIVLVVHVKRGAGWILLIVALQLLWLVVAAFVSIILPWAVVKSVWSNLGIVVIRMASGSIV